MTSLNGIAFDFKDEDTSYLTHSLHPYPAKFPPQLPQRIMRRFMCEGMNVLDPFCGSGTTLVEARLQNINSVGSDINGLACLLSKVKSTPLSDNQLERFEQVINHITCGMVRWKLGNRADVSLPNIEGLDHWFQRNVAEELAWLKTVIEGTNDANVCDLLKIAFASITVQVSNQESDTRYAAINKNIQDAYTINLFLSRCTDYRQRIKQLSQILKNTGAQVEVFNADARNLHFMKSESFDAVITSPPYANTYDYYLYHKFRKRWLNLDVGYAQYNEIGSRREFSSLKKDPSKWFDDLKMCFSEIARVLKSRGLAFIVIGDSVIKKELIRMDEVVAGFAANFHLRLCDIVSSSLAEHSRVFNPSFTQKGKKEHLILLQKAND